MQAQSLLSSSNPVLWLKSSTFFHLCRRRLLDFESLHESCFNAKVSNYRIMSLVLGHLMRHTIVTPIAKEIDLSETMRELRFEKVIQTFGIFYMDISMTHLFCSEIPREDSPLLTHKFKTPFLTGGSEKTVGRLALIPSQLSHQYPWGDSIDINQLQDLIETCSSQFLKPPSFLSEDAMKHPDSAGIFRYFSKEIWLLADDYFCGTASDVDVSDLTAAMKVWTIQKLKGLCRHIALQPSFDGIEVEGNLPKTSFLGRRVHFFPEETDVDGHPCGGYLSSETSYLSMYHKALGKGEDSRTKINEDLDKIFSLLQCLPASRQERNKMVIWKAGGEHFLQFVVNSSLYHVARVISGRKPSNHRVQLTAKMLKKKLV